MVVRDLAMLSGQQILKHTPIPQSWQRVSLPVDYSPAATGMVGYALRKKKTNAPMFKAQALFTILLPPPPVSPYLDPALGDEVDRH